MKFSWKKLPRPIVALSPMADMTDSPFNRVVKSMAPPVIFREMLSAEAIVRGNDKTLAMAEIQNDEHPVIQQIFGADPKVMAQAAKIIEKKFAPDGIDINMGCPARKLVGSFNGAALMKDPDLASEIVSQVKKSIRVPLSVKIRAGWKDKNECIEFVKILENAGADLISIHGRTQKQGYSGKADHQVVAEAKKQVSIPVLYNGDIFSWQDYFSAVDETKCDGALIARGALGNPWIFKQIEDQLLGKTPSEVTLEERVRVVRLHLKYHLARYGKKSITTFRKHLAWYFKGIPGFKQFRLQLLTAPDSITLDKILGEILDQTSV